MVDAVVGARETTAEAEADGAAKGADWLEVLGVVKAVQLREQRELERAE